MAYKFQLGAARLSGSVVQEGGITAEASALSGSSLNVGSANLTAAELELIDGVSAGSVVASKAAIHNSAGSLLVSDDAYVGAVGDPDMLQFDGGSEINVASDLDFNIAKTAGLQLGGVAVSSTAAELNLLDTAVANTVVNSKAVIYGSSGQITGTQITASVGLSASVVQGTMANFGAGGVSTQGNVEGVDFSSSGQINITSDGSAINAAGSITMGAGNDAAIYFDSTDLRVDTAAGADISFRQGGTELASLDENGLDLASGDAYFIDGNSVLNATTLGSAVVASSLTSVGVLTSLTASHARITNLDVVTINSIAQTEETLEVSDKLIVSALSASSANASGGGLRIGGGASSTGHASFLWDHANKALDMNFEGSTVLRLTASALVPESDGAVDLGSSALEFKDIYIDGVAYLDAIDFAGTAITATAGEINLIGGATSPGTTAVNSGDGFLHNDGGTMRMTEIDKIIDASAGDGLSASGVELTLDINGLANSVTTVAQSDILGVVDSAASGDPTKKITFSNLEDQIFSNINSASGQFAMASGGALTAGSGLLSTQTNTTSLATGDQFLINTSSGLRRTALSSIATFVGDNLAVNVYNIPDAGTLQVGFNYWSSHGGAESATLPGSPEEGQVVQVKAASNCSSTNTVTINRAGSHTIDGSNTAIILESPDAAVSLMYVGSDLWKVF
jgi:hypothetical protein